MDINDHNRVHVIEQGDPGNRQVIYLFLVGQLIMNKEGRKATIFVVMFSIGFSHLNATNAFAKTMQEWMDENNKKINEQNQRTIKSVSDALQRDQDSRNASLQRGIEDTKRIQNSMGITITNSSDRINSSNRGSNNSGTNSYPARSNRVKPNPNTTPQRCFSEFLWALRAATSTHAIENYLDLPNGSFTVESLRKTFGNVLKIQDGAISGNDAVVKVQTKGTPSQLNVRMKSDGAYWRIVGF